jgi:hypothetical protein
VVIWGEVMDTRGCMVHPSPISSMDGARKVVALAASSGSNPREVRCGAVCLCRILLVWRCGRTPPLAGPPVDRGLGQGLPPKVLGSPGMGS